MSPGYTVQFPAQSRDKCFLPPQIHVGSLPWPLAPMDVPTGWVLRGVTSTTDTPSPPLCPWDMAGTGRVKETTLYTFFPPPPPPLFPPPLRDCAAVRGDIVRQPVGSTKRWLCRPPYENSRLSSFFLEVSVFSHTHVSLLFPHPSTALSKSLQSQPSPAAHPENSKF